MPSPVRRPAQEQDGGQDDGVRPHPERGARLPQGHSAVDEAQAQAEAARKRPRRSHGKLRHYMLLRLRDNVTRVYCASCIGK